MYRNRSVSARLCGRSELVQGAALGYSQVRIQKVLRSRWAQELICLFKDGRECVLVAPNGGARESVTK
jgi:hypothetical protein